MTGFSDSELARQGYQVDRAKDLAPPERLAKGVVSNVDNVAGLATVAMDEGGKTECEVVGAGWLLIGDRVWVQYVRPSSAFVVARLNEATWVPIVGGVGMGAGWSPTTGVTAPRYRRDSAGYVHMEGKVTATIGANATIFTLVAGHRLAAGRQSTLGAWIVGVGVFPITVNYSNFGVVTLGDPPGVAPVALTLSLSGISFLAEA